MAGAAWVSSPPQRAQRALAAGCNIVLSCNNRQAALAIVKALKDFPVVDLQAHWQALQGQSVQPEDRQACLHAVKQLWQQSDG